MQNNCPHALSRNARIFRKLLMTIWPFCGIAAAGCNQDGLPEFSALAPRSSPPTVRHLVDHIQCEVAASMYRHLHMPDQRIETKIPLAHTSDNKWARLLEENFVASITLTLQATNNEGLNPSLTFPQPFNPIATPGLPGANPIAFSGNFTLGVNGQFDGSQYRTQNIVYLLDLVKLYEEYYKSKGQDGSNRPWSEMNVKDGDFVCPRSELLGGNLGLDEIIDSGMMALDESSDYNVYAMPTASEAGVPTVLRRPSVEVGQNTKL